MSLEHELPAEASSAPPNQSQDQAPSAFFRPPDLRQRYRMTIAYDGTRFHGWQKQLPPDRGPMRTVAGVVEDMLRRVLRQPISLVGSSRTDTGVHALGQVAHFNADCPIPLERMALAFNASLPEDVEVREVAPVPASFDAISDVVSKQYRYRIHNTWHRPLQLRNCVYHCWTHLDLQRMRDAAAKLIGEHDVDGFAAAGHGRENTVRTIHDCHIETAGDEVHIVIAGSGFLYHMVRIIAGTLVEVGRGRFEPAIVDEILATRNRQLAGPTLPAQGLWLEWIRYREG